MIRLIREIFIYGRLLHNPYSLIPHSVFHFPNWNVGNFMTMPWTMPSVIELSLRLRVAWNGDCGESEIEKARSLSGVSALQNGASAVPRVAVTDMCAYNVGLGLEKKAHQVLGASTACTFSVLSIHAFTVCDSMFFSCTDVAMLRSRFCIYLYNHFPECSHVSFRLKDEL